MPAVTHDARRQVARSVRGRRGPAALLGLGEQKKTQSRTDLSFAPELLNIFRPENGWDTRQRAVAIDYPRSFWRIGGDPSAGCNRADGVAASFRWAPGARLTHSPLLDSRCSAFPSRFCKPVEFVLRSWLALLGGLAQLVVRFVARSIAPQSK